MKELEQFLNDNPEVKRISIVMVKDEHNCEIEAFAFNKFLKSYGRPFEEGLKYIVWKLNNERAFNSQQEQLFL